MRLNDEKMQAAREARVRAVVREEIVAALQVLGRAADYEYRSTESEIAERAATTVGAVAENAVVRLTCKHERYTDWGSRSYCSRCGEPEPEPVNPFEPRPLEPGCNHAFATEFQADETPVTTCQICGGVKIHGTR